MDELPSYADLPPAPDGARTAWGLFGPDDNVGLFNLQTPERVLEAARLIRRGVVVSARCSGRHFQPSPMAASRGVPRHRVLHDPGTVGFDDVLDNFFPQGSSQWDSLGHVGYGPNMFYNAATEEDVASGTPQHHRPLGPTRHRRPGGRPATCRRPSPATGRPYDPGTITAYSVGDLEAARPGRAWSSNRAIFCCSTPASRRGGYRQPPASGPRTAPRRVDPGRRPRGGDVRGIFGTATWPP